MFFDHILIVAKGLLNTIKQDWLIAILAIMSSLCLFTFRFLPMNDYPYWVYYAHVLANYEQFKEWFALQLGPIPNLGSTMLLTPLVPLLGAESASKVLLAGYAAAFVLAFAYLARGVARAPSGIELLGLLFVYNYVFYNGFLSFLVGLPLLLATLGLAIRMPIRPSNRDLFLLSLLSVAAYLCHLFIWLPLLAYVVTKTFRKTHSPRALLLLTQILPIILSIVYAIQRAGQTSVSWRLYESLPNKLFSLIGPHLPFPRIDPFPSTVPTLIANGVFVFIVTMLVAVAIKKRSQVIISQPAHSLLFTSLGLFVIAALIPFSWFGGMGSIDQRLSFVTGLVFVCLLGPYLTGRRARTFCLGISVAALFIHTIIFVTADSYLKATFNQILSRPSNAPTYVASVRRPPIYGECFPRTVENLGYAVFPLQAFPLYDAIERPGVVATTFDTALLTKMADARFTMRFGRVQTELERMKLIEDVDFLSEQYDYLLLFGCPEDIRSVAAIWQSISRPTKQGAYYALVDLSEDTARQLPE
jgi:hypothetical protein